MSNGLGCSDDFPLQPLASSNLSAIVMPPFMHHILDDGDDEDDDLEEGLEMVAIEPLDLSVIAANGALSSDVGVADVNLTFENSLDSSHT